MELFFPPYYHSFRCIADRCPDSCCHEWAVDIDPDTAARYRQLPGELGDRLRSVLQDTEDGVIMTIENGRCPMWRADGLCRIHAELGHDALSQTCRDFPRLRHDYGDFVELGLELSCPEAARLILQEGGGFFVQAQPGGEKPDYDKELMEILRSSRKEVLCYLRTASSLPRALAALLLYGHFVQAQLDGDPESAPSPEGCEAQLEQFQLQGDTRLLLTFFKELETLTDRWKQRLSAPPQPIRWSEELRHLACYFVERYWLQAVSDYDLISRVKLTVAACLVVGFLGGEPVETAQLFSKEIENDPDNLEAILNGAYTAQALTDANLLGVLLYED